MALSERAAIRQSYQQQYLHGDGWKMSAAPTPINGALSIGFTFEDDLQQLLNYYVLSILFTSRRYNTLRFK